MRKLIKPLKIKGNGIKREILRYIYLYIIYYILYIIFIYYNILLKF